jgi:hypothetical protein
MRCIPTGCSQGSRSAFAGVALTGLIFFWALVAAPLAASAASIVDHVMFTVGEDGYAFGVSKTDAENSGLEIINIDLENDGVQGEDLFIDSSTVDGTAFLGTTGGATQNFEVTYDPLDWDTAPDVGSQDALLLVFRSFDTAVVGDVSWDYLGSYSGFADPGTLSTVGFTLSPDWLLVSYYDGVLDQTLYFPAVTLGALEKGDSTTVPISFLLTDPKSTPSSDFSTQVILLPALLYDAAFVPIPEPSTGLLLGLGLGGLAWCGSKRSCSRT